MRKINLDTDEKGRRKPDNNDYFLFEAFLLTIIPLIFLIVCIIYFYKS